MTTKREIDSYEKNSDFWAKKGDDFKLIGDFLGRLPALELLDSQPKEVILDAGCGTGFVTRIIAHSGATVFGCDRSQKMLNAAIKREKWGGNPRFFNISYQLANIVAQLPYENNFFDAIFCVAVLMHNSPKECTAFFSEAFRVLKPGGRLIISLTHPSLYKKDSPTTNNQASWLQFNRLSKNIFEENYRDISRALFVANVRCHSKKFINKAIKKVGFNLEKTQEIYITEEILKKCSHTGGVGWPGYYQIKAIKS